MLIIPGLNYNKSDSRRGR